MRLYKSSPDASVSMQHDPRLRDALEDVIRSLHTSHVIETGTFRGLGSTLLVAQAFPAEHLPEAFVTLEVNWHNWRRARANTARFPFVECVWGRSVDPEDGVAFLESDPWLLHHEEHPDLYIDDVEDPVGYYVRELHRGVGRMPLRRVIPYLRDRALRRPGSGLLRTWLEKFRDRRPLIVLDSAGGIGWLEFQIVRETMGERPYVLLLDDIHHIKHARSHRDVVSDPSFEVLATSEQNGWTLARHHGTESSPSG